MADSTIRVVLTGDKTGYSAAMSGAADDAEAAGARVDSTVDDVTSKTGNLFSKLGNSLSNISPILGEPFTKLGDSFSDAESKGHGFASVMSTIGGATLIGLGAGLAGAAIEGLHLADSMDEATNKIAANAGISQAAAKAIGQAFLTTGGQTTFTAQEMATAYAGVAKQLGTTEGHALTAAQALTVMKVAGDLAMATGQSLGSVTSSLAQIMQAYGISVKDASSTSDMLYNASRMTGTGITTEASTLATLKARLGDAAPPMAQLTALQADLAMHGEAGSRILRTMATSLTGLMTPTTAVTAAQQQMGVSFVNANGQMDSMSEIIGKVQPIIAGMGNAQATATLKALGFGTASAMLVSTIQAGTTAYDTASKAVTAHGTAEAGAEKATDNLHDTMKKLEVEVEDLTTRFGEVLMPVLEDVIHDVTDAVNWFTKHKDVAIALAGVIGGVLSVAVGVFAVNKLSGMISSLKSAYGELQTFGQKAITAGQNMLGLGNQTEATAATVQSAGAEQNTALEETATTAETTSATMEGSLTALQASVEELAASIQTAAAQIATSFGEIATDTSAVAADFSADMTTMEGELATFRAEAETPIVMPPVVPSALPAAAGAEGVAVGEGAVVGETTVASGATAEEGAVGGTALGATAAGGLSAVLLPTAIGAAVGMALHGPLEEIAENTASKAGQKPPGLVQQTEHGAADLGATLTTLGGSLKVETGVMNTVAQYASHIPVIGGLVSSFVGKPTPTPAWATSAEASLNAIKTSAAKDASIKAQASTFTGMLSQLTVLKAGSAQYEQALKGIQQTGDKWYPEFAKDKTATQFGQTIDKLYANAVVTNTKLEGVVKDQSLKSAESHLASLQTQLSKETTQGATKATLDSTRGLIDQELGHIATIHQLTTQLHKDSTAISVGKDLETVATKVGADTKSKLDNVTISHIVGMKASGAIKALIS